MTYPQPPAPASPAPSKPRPGAALGIWALVLAIVGLFAACLGFFAGAVPALAIPAFCSWAAIIAAFVLAIIALVKKARGMGISIAALIVAAFAGVAAVASMAVIIIFGLVETSQRIYDEVRDGIPSSPAVPTPDATTDPGDPDADAALSPVERDCRMLLENDTSGWSLDQPLDTYLRDLADDAETDEVETALDELADAFEAFTSAEETSDIEQAAAEMQVAGEELVALCGDHIDIPSF